MLFDKLRQIEERSHEIARRLADPAIFSQQAEYARLRKEHSDTQEIVERFTRVSRRPEDASARPATSSAEGGDRELHELAQAEIDELSGRQTALEAELKRLLLPRDPNDDKNVFVEIRAGAGGDEAALFAADLARMYTKYAERQRWKVEMMDTQRRPASAASRKSSCSCRAGARGAGSSSSAACIACSGCRSPSRPDASTPRR